ncbi:MAG: hypothetical protein AAF713_02120 [Pseudomonadota bacterium]
MAAFAESEGLDGGQAKALLKPLDDADRDGRFGFVMLSAVTTATAL